jgi:PST family polysaccharide transporter
MISLSPLIAVFYKQPELMKLSMVLGTTFFISSISSVPNAILSKEMQFERIAIVEISVIFISGITGILFALRGFGVWSLVYKSVVGAVLSSFLLFIATKWKPVFFFNWYKIKDMFSFGANLTGFGVLNYFHRNLDNLLIGRFLGPILLGYYNFSYSILLFPVFQISGALGRVFFPALSSIQEDLPRVRNIYTQTTFYISVITFPLMIGIFILAPEFVRTIFGPKWIPAIIVLRILVLIGMIQSIVTTQGWIYGVTGRTDIMLKWGFFSFIVVAISFVIGLRYGIVGVASAYAIACCLLVIPGFYIPFRFIELNIWKFFGNFKSTFFISVIMGIIVTMLRHILKMVNLGDWGTLIICAIVGSIIYIGLLWVFKKQIFKELREYIKTGLSQ